MYAKLFTSIYQGTLRGNSHGLLVFTNMLAHCDRLGVCDIHPRAIAEEVGLTVEQVKAAIEELEAPDDESRSPEENGRRIKRLDDHRAWGWQVVNYVKYRAIRDEEDRREQNRLAQERWRERNENKHASADVSTHKQRKPPSAHAEAEADTEKNTKRAGRVVPVDNPKDVDPQVWADFLTQRKVMRATVTATAIEGIRREAEKAGISLEAALRECTARGWRGFKADWVSKDGARVPETQVWKPDAPLSGAERAAADEARRRALAGIRRVA